MLIAFAEFLGEGFKFGGFAGFLAEWALVMLILRTSPFACGKPFAEFLLSGA